MAFINPIPPIPSVAFDANLGQALSFFPPIPPILMLPVRLETRFSPRSDGGSDLRIRIYPDKVHIDTHEPELTEAEITWGKHFWDQTWRAANDPEARRIAWRQLVERFDANRAAWVARTLTPLNLNQSPTEPIPSPLPLPKLIKFPNPPMKAAAWTRAPLTKVLPKMWWAFGYRGGKLIVRAGSLPTGKPLATGPNPAAPEQKDPAAGELAIDEEMKWMVDFEEAVKVGMGIRMRLSPEQAQGFDFLLVFGTRAGIDIADGTPDVINLFDAHHYTDGLSFVPQGTPSNNTVDAPSGFRSVDPGDEQSYLSEREQVAFKLGDESNAEVLARALGLQAIKPPTFANIPNASETEQLDARHMNRALWPASWGYFLTQMMIGSSLTPDDIKWARQHFTDYVRAAGPLPTLRIGKQPYGVLPVTSLDLWKPKTGGEQGRDVALKNFLKKMRDAWRVNVQHVPRLGKSQNPDQDFKDILSMDGLSSTYAIRHLLGENYLVELWPAVVAPKGNQHYWFAKQQELTRVPLIGLALPWNPRIARATYSGWYASLKGPVIQPGTVSENAGLKPNYLELLLKETDLEKLRSETFGDVQPQGLLYSVLRHAMLLEYWMAASKLTPLPVFDGPPQSRRGFIRPENEIVRSEAFTPWHILRAPLPGITDSSAWTFLSKLEAAPADPAVAEHVTTLLEFRKSLEYLNTPRLTTARLQRLFAGTLDLCSHRLDAWITSMATRRLAEMREKIPRGILLGGYGWVVNLKPGPVAEAAPAPAGKQGQFFRPPNNPGYSHAPSLAQAATVAVLRSGHQAHANTETQDLLAIDLSSERVRLAEWLLDGVRQGQPLGALLGYRFERRLQDARPPLGQFIPSFREVAPLVAKKLEDSGQPAESIAANNVVDGLVLQGKWTAAGNLSTLFGQIPGVPNRTPDQKTALRTELEALDEAVDAVSDALVAESVHQAIHGNSLRAASTLDAVANGEAPPPELEVVRTPRTGLALTYRLVVLFGGPTAAPAGWGDPPSPRANAEPYLNRWVANLLGDPTRLRCLVERIDPDTAEVIEVKDFRLKDLNLSPIDYVYAAEGSREASSSEIEKRILFAMSRDSFPPEAILRTNPGRDAGWAATDLSFGEFSELVRRAQRLITGTRGIDASDLALPEQNQPGAIDLSDLKTRADDAAKGLRDARTDLQALLDSSNPDLEKLRQAILRSSQFGIAGSVPFSAQGDSAADRQALVTQGNSIASELLKRVDDLDKLEKNFNAENATNAQDGEKAAHEVDRLRAVFGNSFVVLPRFSAANAPELERALADSSQIQANDPLAVVTWFQRVSRVREGVERLDFSLRYAEVLGNGAQLSLKIAQLPYRKEDRWVGLPLGPGHELSLSRFSLVVQAAPDLNVNKPMTGLLIDEWVEVVPNAKETTATVFQYDQPDASPPQSILLAVPPDLDQPWNLWSMQQVLLEALDLARIRAVDPEALDEIGHYIPSLYFAANSAGDAISTDFSKLK
jgi:hypothetical protein